VIQVGEILAPNTSRPWAGLLKRRRFTCPIASLFKPAHDLGERNLAPFDGEVASDDFPHVLVETLQLLLAQAGLAAQLEAAVKTRPSECSIANRASGTVPLIAWLTGKQTSDGKSGTLDPSRQAKVICCPLPPGT